MSDLVPFEGAKLGLFLRERFEKLMKSRIKGSPVHALRASSIGHECERYLFYEQTQHEKRVMHGVGLQALFDLGNQMEAYTVRLLEDMDFVIEERNRSFHDRQHQITGHLDGRLRLKSWPAGFTIPIEIKGLNPYTADTIETIDHIRHAKSAWVRRYYSQLQMYQWLGDDQWGLFVLLNKSTGWPEFIPCQIDRPFIAKLLEKADLVRDAVLSGKPPERRRTQECSRCPYVHVCLPDIDFGPGLQTLDVPELVEAIRLREENREAHKSFESADRIIKKLLPKEPGDLLIGPYQAVGVKQDRKAFAVDATSFVKWEIREVSLPPAGPPILDPFTGPRYLERAEPEMSAVPVSPPAEENEFD